MTAVDPLELDDQDDQDAAQPAQTSSSEPERGVCKVCGNPARTPRGVYCEEHATRAGRPVDPKPNPAAAAAAAATGRRQGGRPSNLETELRTMFEMMGQTWSLFDPHCGPALTAAAPGMAEYWAGQARSSERIRRALESLTHGGGFLGAVSAHLPILYAIYAHHVLPVLMARQAPAVIVEAPDVGPVDAFADQAAPDPTTNGHAAAPWDLSGTPQDVAFMDPGQTPEDGWPRAPGM